jgi:TRAP-type C4-dicarboxylate transport system permease large subunit
VSGVYDRYASDDDPELIEAALPMLALLATGVALITALPQMSLWLPRWFAGGGP